ncbi:MAG: Rrf2 family transcriptional regulator [Candidatus Staskawiczbacteria bacterium]|nr:Rrf2 family transcriptional regulator [Candidatus Staskawiczbacteria bacterium]
MKISKRAEYGLMAMVCLTKNKKTISIREISNIEVIPYEFLAKIFAKLESAKLVKAKHGANGGYVLTKASNKISVNDIISALEGNKKTVDCVCCQRKTKCLAKDVWAKLEKSLNKTLEQVKLSDLIK